MKLLEGLNDAQIEAVETTEGPLLVLAGAGSGKTKALTHRIAYLITAQHTWPDRILAVTFTNKAAKEMRERLSDLLNQPNSRNFMPWMGTFHGICVRLLKIDGSSLGIANNFVIYDEDDRQGLIKQAMKELAITDRDIKPRAVSAAISTAKNEMQDPQAYQAAAEFPYQKTIGAIYERYETLRRTAQALDFDDLLLETVRLLREHEDIRRKWQEKFQYILIDEYQDTNAAQYHIVKLLVNEDRNIAVVGDDWQSIYSWRGADFTNILNFERDFPGAKVVKLEQNYRSTGNILDAAQSVITKNTQRTDKQLWTAFGPGAPVQFSSANDDSEEAAQVAERIAAQVAIGARQYNDFAVLYRTNAQSYSLERALLRYRIPYRIVGGVRFYDRKEIKDVIAYLRLLHQPNDRMSFSRIVNVPTRGVGATSLEKFLLWQSESGFDILSALINVEQTRTLTPRARQALSKLGEVLRRIQSMIESHPPAEIITHLLEAVRYQDYLRDGTPQAEEREANIDSLLSDAQNFVALADFLEEVALMSSADQAEGEAHVTLMTLHASKGLEFPVVHMVGLEEGILPHSRIQDAGPQELEEERRLCYVGMTRAREELHLSHAYSRVQFGQRTYNPVSRFVADMGAAIAMTQTTPEFGARSQSYQHDTDEFYSDEPFSIGDTVRSAAFGTGRVSEVEGMAVTVEFSSGQTKRLNAEYARLEKIS